MADGSSGPPPSELGLSQTDLGLTGQFSSETYPFKSLNDLVGKEVDRLNKITGKVNNMGIKDVWDPEIRREFVGMVRNPGGRPDLDKYTNLRDSAGKLTFIGSAFLNGAQGIIDIDNHAEVEYVRAVLGVKKEFIQGLESHLSCSPEEFQEWMLSLHKKLSEYYGEKGREWGGKLTPRVNDKGEQGYMGANYTEVFADLREVAKKYGDPFADDMDMKTRPLPGIPESQATRFFSSTSTGVVFILAPEEINSYFSMMQQEIQKAEASRQNNDEEGSVREIAKFYQYSMRTHPHRYVNNSLYMNLTNSLLELQGLRPIEHGVLDFAAFVFSQEGFVQLFLDEVERRNPVLASEAPPASNSDT